MLAPAETCTDSLRTRLYESLVALRARLFDYEHGSLVNVVVSNPDHAQCPSPQRDRVAGSPARYRSFERRRDGGCPVLVHEPELKRHSVLPSVESAGTERLGLSLPGALREKIRAAHDEGVPLAAIARAAGISRERARQLYAGR
jgi:hypothetical protein